MTRRNSMAKGHLGIAALRWWFVLFGVFFLVGPAAAQWSRVTEVEASDIFSVLVKGDTIVAGADTAVYVSTNGGVTWKRSAKVAAAGSEVRAVLVHNGRLYAGTLGQGVFVSSDLGTTWLGFSQGLAGPAALTIVSLSVRGDSLYVATLGAGAFVRNLASGPWTLFGSQTLQNFQATNMDGGIAVGGSQLFAGGGFNGTVFIRNPGDPDWTASLLFNDRFAPGLAPLNAIWTGHRWVVGSNIGIFHSVTGREPWTFVDFGLHSLFFAGLAQRDADVYASLGLPGGSPVVLSHDEGVTWQSFDLIPVGVYRLAVHGSDLYASQVNGLWRRTIATVSVSNEVTPPRLQFAIAGSQPAGDEVRFQFDLPMPGPVAIDVFDVTGRRAADSIRGSWSAGPHELAWDARALGPGIYLARMTAGAESAVAKLIRVR